MNFADRLTQLVESRKTQVVVGLDPDPGNLWPEAYRAVQQDGKSKKTYADAVSTHCRLVLEAVKDSCVAVKFQLACFERLGSEGIAALENAVSYAKELGLLTIADGKRGDVPVTASVYAEALFSGEGDSHLGLAADSATLNPLLGVDSLRPLIKRSRSQEAGVFLLVRTSNPGAADVQDLELKAGVRLWEYLATLVNDLGSEDIGSSGLASVGAVVGATEPEHLERARELMPRAVFLLPGVGAQGGDATQLAPAFAPGRAGGLITASRSIVNAYLDQEQTIAPAAAAKAAAEQIREQAWG